MSKQPRDKGEPTSKKERLKMTENLYLVITKFLCRSVTFFFVVNELLGNYMLPPSNHHLYSKESELISILIPGASNFYIFTKIVLKHQRNLNM